VHYPQAEFFTDLFAIGEGGALDLAPLKKIIDLALLTVFERRSKVIEPSMPSSSDESSFPHCSEQG